MLGFIKKIFGGKPAEVTAEAPYKVDAPVEAPVEVLAVPPVAEAAPAPKKPAPKKQQFAKKSVAPKTAAPKPTTAKPKAPPKPKAKPAA
jgi:hypothetical protein